jgi:nucleoside-diphosphate-sugar epimerase
MTKRILVTGANGFVGKAVINRLSRQPNVTPIGSVRTPPVASEHISSPLVVVPSLERDTCWTEALSGVSCVIHCAARVHIMNEHGSMDEKLEKYRQVNVNGTLNLAQQAVKAGVSRFVFVSTIKVNGEFTPPSHPFCANDPPAPCDPYGLSKLEAEIQLRQLAENTGLEVTIVRPPLVYGAGVKANFASLINWVSCGIPLPLGCVHHNRRSLVALDNLADLLTVCIEHPEAANRTFLVSDGEDLSTAELVQRIAHAQGKRARLLPVPVTLLRTCASLLRKRDTAQRLLSNLQVDITSTRELLGWRPPLTVDEGLRLAVQGTLS